MPETSIVIKTQDKSSDGLKTIAKNAADLGSKLRDLQDKAHSCSKEADEATAAEVIDSRAFSDSCRANRGIILTALQTSLL